MEVWNITARETAKPQDFRMMHNYDIKKNWAARLIRRCSVRLPQLFIPLKQIYRPEMTRLSQPSRTLEILLVGWESDPGPPDCRAATLSPSHHCSDELVKVVDKQIQDLLMEKVLPVHLAIKIKRFPNPSIQFIRSLLFLLIIIKTKVPKSSALRSYCIYENSIIYIVFYIVF
jgi:hypothetical protein